MVIHSQYDLFLGYHLDCVEFAIKQSECQVTGTKICSVSGALLSLLEFSFVITVFSSELIGFYISLWQTAVREIIAYWFY